MSRAGDSLQGFLEKNGPLVATEISSILLQIVTGLLEVGDLVHRDLKPDNVLFHEGKWKIADFGIARFVEEATASNTVKDCLSPYYTAPEQWKFERANTCDRCIRTGVYCVLSSCRETTLPFKSI